MKRLYLLRHGSADPRPPDGSDSPERRLVKKGRAQARRAGRLLARLGVGPARVVASDYLRASQTAEEAIAATGAAGLEVTIERRLRPVASLARARQALIEAGAALPADAALLAVGHEPLLSTLAASIVGSRGLTLDLRKGGLIEIEIVDGAKLRGTLLGLLRPRHLS